LERDFRLAMKGGVCGGGFSDGASYARPTEDTPGPAKMEFDRFPAAPPPNAIRRPLPRSVAQPLPFGHAITIGGENSAFRIGGGVLGRRFFAGLVRARPTRNPPPPLRKWEKFRSQTVRGPNGRLGTMALSAGITREKPTQGPPNSRGGGARAWKKRVFEAGGFTQSRRVLGTDVVGSVGRLWSREKTTDAQFKRHPDTNNTGAVAGLWGYQK